MTVAQQALAQNGEQPMRRRILQAATSAFCAKGYRATTVREILHACGVTPAAMYNHYKSKDELLYAIYQEAHEEVSSGLNKARDAAKGDPVKELRLLIVAFVEFQATHHETAQVIDNNYVHLPEPWKSTVMAQRRGFRGMFLDAIQRGAAAGYFTLPPAAGRTPPALLATIVIGDYCMRVASWFDPAGGATPIEVGEIYAGMAFRMLGA